MVEAERDTYSNGSELKILITGPLGWPSMESVPSLAQRQQGLALSFFKGTCNGVTILSPFPT